MIISAASKKTRSKKQKTGQVKLVSYVLSALNALFTDIEQGKLLTTEKLFVILKDGEWHDLTDLSDQIQVHADKLTEFLQFLSKHDIIAYEHRTHRIKIKPEWQNLRLDETEPTVTHHNPA